MPFDFINSKVENGTIAGVTSITTTGTPVSLGGRKQPSMTLTGLTGILTGSAGITGSAYGSGALLSTIYVVNGLIVSASA